MTGATSCQKVPKQSEQISEGQVTVSQENGMGYVRSWKTGRCVKSGERVKKDVSGNIEILSVSLCRQVQGSRKTGSRQLPAKPLSLLLRDGRMLFREEML